LRHAPEESRFLSPIAVQLAHCRSEQDAIELLPVERQKKTVEQANECPRGQNKPKVSKKQQKNAKKTQKNVFIQ
jgi:hypothetical protein